MENTTPLLRYSSGRWVGAVFQVLKSRLEGFLALDCVVEIKEGLLGCSDAASLAHVRD